MVAYSFQERFVPLIREGYKRQTVRSHRPRHARPGELIQLYQGMRTKLCAKIVEDVICTHVSPIEITFRHGLIDRIVTGWPALLSVPDPDAFAIEDGFEDREDMSAFWTRQHKPALRFSGVLIEWARRAGPDRSRPLSEIQSADGLPSDPAPCLAHLQKAEPL